MNTNKQKTRAEIPNEYKWNIEAMYPVENELYIDIDNAVKLAEELHSMQGSCMNSPSNLLRAIELYLSSIRAIEKAYVYSHMKHDEDAADSKYTEIYTKSIAAFTKQSALVSFFIPEILESSLETVHEYISKEKDLEIYRFMLDEIMVNKDHTLSKSEEYIIASLQESLNCTNEIFSILNDADMDFGTVKDNAGVELPLTHATYIQYMEDKDRDFRKSTYHKLYEKYKEFNNTISSLYSFNVKSDVAVSKLRKYSSTLERALSANNIPIEVYTSLIDAVNKHLPSMHKYVEIRKKALNLKEIKMYDIYTPLVKPEGLKYTFEEAVDIACKALSPLGDEYVETLRRGILEEKWVDIYENKGKRSGAYSFGSYDSYPYILMNFTGDLRDIFTLVHEGGHSMHSYYTRHNQPYVYGDYPIFSAEVASTVNETLLIHYLLDNCESKEMRAYLINFYIDEFKSTLFRQTMFAEFEKITHEAVESGEALTSDYLNETYSNLNDKYFGPQLSKDDMIQYEWSRIPHFYNSYYVYQYATGYSAANAIAYRILTEGEKAKDDYIKFLSSGSSDYPINLLKIAGVDMSTEQPIMSALNTFDKLVNDLEEILNV